MRSLFFSLIGILILALHSLGQAADQSLKGNEGFEVKGLGLQITKKQLSEGWNNLWVCRNETDDPGTEICKYWKPISMCGDAFITPSSVGCYMKQTGLDMNKLQARTKQFLTVADIELFYIEITFFDGSAEKINIALGQKSKDLYAGIQNKYGTATRAAPGTKPNSNTGEIFKSQWVRNDEVLQVNPSSIFLLRSSLIEARKAREDAKLAAAENAKRMQVKPPLKDI